MHVVEALADAAGISLTSPLHVRHRWFRLADRPAGGSPAARPHGGDARHRGPDDRGHFSDGPAAIGAARLSIIDVAGGHQPISIDGGGITVAQNGEIYNYVELRDELEQTGRRTATACDTEVIAHLYATEGIAGFRRMRGMFAVAIWDAPRQRLVLARDRVGKKPLYFIEHRGELLFGSETKAILAALDDAPRVNAGALLSFFTFGYVAGADAIFRGHAPARARAPRWSIDARSRRGDRRSASGLAGAAPMHDASSRRRRRSSALRAELTEAVRIRTALGRAARRVPERRHGFGCGRSR